MEKFKRLILVVLGAFLLPTMVLAQDDISQGTGIVGNGRFLGAKTSDSQTTVPVLGVDSSSNTVVNALSGKQVNLAAAKTPVAQFAASGNTLASGLTLTTGNLTATAGGISLSTAGKYINATVESPTVAATPVTGTNLCNPGVCAIPTFAANGGVFVGAATPIAGTQFYIKNVSANTERAKAAGGATINGAVAGGYIGLVTGASMHCLYYTVGDLVCDTYTTAGGTTAALPTPAGP